MTASDSSEPTSLTKWSADIASCVLAAAFIASAASVANVGAAEPAGLPKRQVLESTRVVGSPDPPPPYRVRRVLPHVKLNLPIAVARQPDTDLLWVIHQLPAKSTTALVRFREDDASPSCETLFAADETAYDLVFHPRFPENGFVYVGSNGAYPDVKAGKKTRVTRYTVERAAPYRFDPKSAVVIIEWLSDGHNGAALSFGKDGMLYVTSGDGTSDSDTNLKGQGLEHLLAKVLRIDVDHAEPGKTYRVPPDNPFVGRPDARPETWAYGLRNPWRMTVDPVTGNLWVGNNGQDLWEQVYLVKKGDNYGWSVMEGSHPFYLQRQAGPTPFVKPTAEHPHSEARSLTGGVVYYGTKFPDLRGAYVYGDYSTGKIWGLRHDGEKTLWHKELADSTLAITGFGLDRHGELLICDHRGNDEGGFYTLEPQPADAAARTDRFPRKLSETGLFPSVAGHVTHPALIPYSVNSPLWSDGAHKERFIALVGAEAKIDAAGQRGWNFPNGTVLVKSFALEGKAGDPATRRWIETRLLTRQDNEWVGYSYLWNEAQTEADLVAAEGLDREYTIAVAGTDGQPATTRHQTWRFPSRAECMVCHSRAANYVLGLTTAQMNRDHSYGGASENQLRLLAKWDVLRNPWPQPVEQLERLVDPYDARADLELRRSFVPPRELFALPRRSGRRQRADSAGASHRARQAEALGGTSRASYVRDRRAAVGGAGPARAFGAVASRRKTRRRPDAALGERRDGPAGGRHAPGLDRVAETDAVKLLEFRPADLHSHCRQDCYAIDDSARQGDNARSGRGRPTTSYATNFGRFSE